MVGSVCPVCDGKRLKREALSVTFAGLDIGALAQLSLTAMAEVLQPAAAGPLRRDRGATTAGDARRARRVGARATRRAAWPPAARRTPARPTCAARPTCRRKSASPRSASPHDLRRAHRARCRRSASATSRSTAARRRCRPANCSGCAWRRRSARNLFGVVYVLDEPTAGPASRRRRGAARRARRSCKRVGQLDLRRRARPGR